MTWFRRFTRFERVWLCVILGVVALGLFLGHTNPRVFEDRYVVEDGPVEWLTVIALLAGAGVCFLACLNSSCRKKCIFLPLACLFLFGAGEEISWGQRLLGIKSSDFFRHNNAQGEMNLHNLVLGGVKLNKLIFSTLLGVAMILYLVVFPILYRKKASIRALADRWNVPVPRSEMVMAFFVMAALIFTIPSKKCHELLEFAGAALFVLIVRRPLNAEGRVKESSDTAA